jgi:hypothetical protein
VTTGATSQTIRFYNNSFNHTAAGKQGTWVLMFTSYASTVRGVSSVLFDHNTWNAPGGNGFDEQIHNYGANNQTTDFSGDVVPGSLDAVYIEYSKYIGGAANYGAQLAGESYAGGRTVIRNNSFLNGVWDSHGAPGVGTLSACSEVETRWTEIYNNTVNLTANNDYPTINLRGGSGVVFNNTHAINGVPGGGSIQFQNDCDNTLGGTYPYQDQDGRGITISSGSSTTHSSPWYTWNNGTFGCFTQSHDAGQNTSLFIQAGREYFCTSGSQPSPITRCESAADVVAGCPVNYQFVPAVSPHPLDNCPTSVIGVVSGGCTGGGASTPVISVTPGAPNFGTVTIPGNVVQQLTVTNSGTGTETLSTPYYAITGTNASDFTNITVPAPSAVQNASIDAGTGTTGSLAFINSNLSSDLIVVAIRSGSTGQTFGVTDTNGNTYHLATQFIQPTDLHTGAVYYAMNVGSGANTVTVTQTSSATLRFSIMEFAGILTSGALDVTTFASGSSISPSSGNATTTQNWDLVIGATTTANPQTFTPGTGFTAINQPGAKLFTEYTFAKTAGPVAATSTLGTTDLWAAGVVAFKAANTTGANGCSSGATLAANGGTCNITISFAPALQGTRTATLAVNGTASTTAAMTGVGQSAASAPSVPTGFTVTGSGGAGAPINLNWTASTGTPTITYNCLVSIPSQGIGGPYSIFANTVNTTCANFIPGHTGTYYFSVSASNSAGTSAMVSPVPFVVAAATSPQASLGPAVNFNPIPQGQTSGTVFTTLTSVGTANLVVSSVTITGTNAADFAIVSTSPSGCGTLAPAATCTIGVSFTPSLIGTVESASVSVASNDPASPTTLALTGQGTGTVSVTPLALSFPNQLVNHTSPSQTVTFFNNTGATVTFSSVTLTTGTQFAIGTNGCTGTLAYLASCTTTLTFTPTSTGSKTDTLTYTFTGVSGSPITVSLVGAGSNHKVRKGVTM